MPKPERAPIPESVEAYKLMLNTLQLVCMQKNSLGDIADVRCTFSKYILGILEEASRDPNYAEAFRTMLKREG